MVSLTSGVDLLLKPLALLSLYAKAALLLKMMEWLVYDH